MEKDHLDSLCTVVFSGNKIQLNNKLTPFYLGDDQFIIGNLKKMPGQPDVLIFLNVAEGWGESVFLVSVDQNHRIIDMAYYCSSGGDGGDFSNTEIKYQDFFNYFFIYEVGYESLTSPIDTTKYTKTIGKITLKDGYFEKSILKVDSNIVELKQADY